MFAETKHFEGLPGWRSGCEEEQGGDLVDLFRAFHNKEKSHTCLSPKSHSCLVVPRTRRKLKKGERKGTIVNRVAIDKIIGTINVV